MLYLKNSLVNLTIILFFSFFLTVSIADDGAFIFPKKKIIIIKPVNKNQIDVKKNNVFELSDLPQKKPIETKIIKQKNLTENNKNSKLVEDSNIKKKSFSAELPLKKPTKKKVKKDQTINAPYLETETKKNIQKLKKNLL